MRDEEKTREQLLAENASLRAKLSELNKAESECRWVEAALRESEERYKRLLESITDYIYTVKVESGRPVSTSHGLGCIAVTGYTSEHYQMYPNLWYEMIHEEDRKAVLDQAEKLLKGEAAEPLEHRIIHKDGSIRWVRNTPVPHYDKDGNLDSYDGIIVDITERKRAEELLVSTFERITDAFVALDTEWRYTYVNKKAGQIFGRRAEDLIGKHIWTEFPEGINQPFYRAYYKAVAEQIPIQIEDYYPPYDRWFENRIYPSKDGLTIYFQDITERKRAEEVLRRSENVLRMYIEYSPAAVAMFDRNMKYIAVSRRYLADYSLGEQDLIGRSHYEVFPEMPERWKEIHRRCLAGVVEKSDQDPFPRADGRLDWVRWEIRPWHESSGEIGGIILFSEVITERVRALETVRESEARIRNIFEQASDGIFLITAENRYLDVNARGLEMFGYTREELLQMTVADVVVARERPRLAVEPAEMLAGKPHLAEWEHLRKDGSTFPAEVSARRLDEKTYIAIVRDQTERKKAEEATRESEEKLQRIINGSSAVIFVKDLNGKYLLINSLYEKLFHVSKSEIIGKTDYDVFPKEVAETLRDADKKALMANKPIEAEEIVPQDDGIHYYISLKFPLYNVQGKPYAVCGIATDITERKKAEETLKQRFDELVRFEKATIQREFRMKELKEEVKRLKERIGEMEGNLKKTKGEVA